MEDLKVPAIAYISIKVPDYKEGHQELEELLNILKSKGYGELTGVTEWFPNGWGTVNVNLKKEISPNKEFQRKLDTMIDTLRLGLNKEE